MLHHGEMSWWGARAWCAQHAHDVSWRMLVIMPAVQLQYPASPGAVQSMHGARLLHARDHTTLPRHPPISPNPMAACRWVFWADERNVAHSSPDSNYKGAQEDFLSKVPIPAEQV